MAGGSSNVFWINKSLTPSNPLAQVSGAAVYGGTLGISNLGALPFVAGDSFKLFAAASDGGSFTNILPLLLGVNFPWNTNNLAGGVINEASSPAAPPQFSGIHFGGNQAVVTGSIGISDWPYCGRIGR